MKNTAQLCSSLIGFEERAAELYLTLARHFTANQKLSWFWLEKGLEEKQHATLLDFCGSDPMFTAQLPDAGTFQRISEHLDELESRANRKNLSIDDAFLIAAELEGSELDTIYGRLANSINGTDYVLRRKFESLIPNQKVTLLQYAQRFGVSAKTMARLVELSSLEVLPT